MLRAMPCPGRTVPSMDRAVPCHGSSRAMAVYVPWTCRADGGTENVPPQKGYLVKTKSFVFGHIAEISARYRRENDRMGAARLFFVTSTQQKSPERGWRALGPILRTDP